MGLYKRSIIIALSNILARALGLIVIFPFIKVVGNEAIKLYNYAYIPTLIAADISSLGVVPGTSKLIATNPNGYIIKKLRYVFYIVGIIAMILFNILTPIYTKIITGDTNYLVIRCMRIASISLLIYPLLSCYRGYLIGNLKVVSNFASNILEQSTRVLLMLIGAIVIINVFNMNSIYAIYFAFIANIIGLLVGLIPLKIAINKIKLPVSKTPFLFTYFKLCLKIGITTIFITIYNLIDSLTYNRLSYEENKDELYKIVTFESQRVIIIPIIIIQSLAQVLMPELSKDNNFNSKKYKVNNVINLSLYFLIIVSIFSFLFYKRIYNFFYDGEGAIAFRLSIILIIAFSLNKIMIGIIEGIYKNYILAFSSILSFLVKLLLNIYLIPKIGYKAMIISSFIGSMILVFINIIRIKDYFSISLYNLCSIISISLISVFILINLNIGIIWTGILYLFIIAFYYLLITYRPKYIY